MAERRRRVDVDQCLHDRDPVGGCPLTTIPAQTIVMFSCSVASSPIGAWPDALSSDQVMLQFSQMARASPMQSQSLSMPVHMLGHECRDKVIGMIVIGLHADRGGNACGLAGFDKQFGFELFGKKAVGAALVDQ